MSLTSLHHLALNSQQNTGRLVEEPSCALRNDFDRDRDRIIHSNAFRRLAYKTQVFVYHEGDHFRSRLTHSLEVAQIARSMARQLGLNEAITEAIALAHDLGHPPFGHTGEDALNEVMADYGGFDHNAQAFARVAFLEHGYARFNGLNLTFECLDGILKHNGPIKDENEHEKSHLFQVLKRSNIIGLIGKDAKYPYPFLEAQLAAIADDIAYTAHDVDDGLRAKLFSLNDLRENTLANEAISSIESLYCELETGKIIFEIKRYLITVMVNSVVENIHNFNDRMKFTDWREITQYENMIAVFDNDMKLKQKQLFEFLFEKMYRHEDVVEVRKQKDHITKALFYHYKDNPAALTKAWPDGYEMAWLKQSLKTLDDETIFARKICDFISGMTDRYAENCYQAIQ